MITGAENKILVACIGNIFLGDDGFGVEMARELQSAHLPPEVAVVDFGIRGFDLAYALLEPWCTVVLVDAIVRGGSPGDLYLLLADKEEDQSSAPPDPHAMNPYHVMALASSFGEIVSPVYVLGCEPDAVRDDFEGNVGLSPAVSAALPAARRMLLEWINAITSQPAMHNAARIAIAQEER